jgi:hypothetical protein
MTSSTTLSTPPRALRNKKMTYGLTPLQLAELKKGPTATILIGSDGDRYVGLEGGSVSLLAHFSPLAKKKLVDERGTHLVIPNGSKQPLTWIYKYMRAGEKVADDQPKFETLSVDQLVLLYTHSAFLEYQHLMDRVVGRVKAKYHASLPSVEELQTFAAFVPPLFDYAIGVLAHELINPWACNYSAYHEYATNDQAFADALDSVIEKLLAHRGKEGERYYDTTSNRAVAYSKAFYKNVGKNLPTTAKQVNAELQANANAKAARSRMSEAAASTGVPKTATHKSTKCHTCGNLGHLARNCTTPTVEKPVVPKAATFAATGKPTGPANPSTSVTCYNYGQDGHMIRDCTFKVAPKVKPVFKCYNCSEEGHLSRDCTKEKKAKRQPPTCYNCRGEGHLSSDCTAPRKDNYQSYQVQRAYCIEVAGNGEGLRTCDREVKKGEKTRTGLVI